MGSAEKKALKDLIYADLPIRSKRLQERGAKFLFVIDEQSFPVQGAKSIVCAGHFMRALSEELFQLMQNESFNELLNKQIDYLKIRHDGSVVNPNGFEIRKENKVLILSACFSHYSTDATIKLSLEKMLVKALIC